MNEIAVTERPTMEGLCHENLEAAALIRDAFARICDKWSLMILGMLDGGAQRFTALRNNVPGISHRMLTLSLRNLERDGLVARTVFAEVPPRVEYRITQLGETVLPAVLALANWALLHGEEIRANRDVFDDAKERNAFDDAKETGKTAVKEIGDVANDRPRAPR